MITDLHRPVASPVPATSPPPTRTPPPARPHLNFCHSHCLPTFYCGWDKWTHSWTHRGLLRPALQGAWALGTHQGRTWTKVPPSKMTASWPVSETPETRASLPRVDSQPRHPRTECSSPSALGRAGRQLQRLPPSRAGVGGGRGAWEQTLASLLPQIQGTFPHARSHFPNNRWQRAPRSSSSQAGCL